MDGSIEVFGDDYGGIEGVALVLRDPSIWDYEGELSPCCKLSPVQAIALAAAVVKKCAREIQGRD